MTEPDFIRFCLQTALILLVAITFGQLARRLRCPAVFGELIGGVILGPTILGWAAPSLFQWIFPTTGPVAAGRDVLARLGLLCFLFVAGLEMNLPALNARRRAIIWASLLGILIPFLSGYTMARLQGGSSTILPLFMGTALSISALPVIARVLMDLGLQRTEVASVVLGAAVIDDLIGWSLFGLILALASHQGAASATRPWFAVGVVLVLMAFALTLGRRLVRRVGPWLRARLTAVGSLIGVAAVVSLLAAAGVEALGFHAVFGAFLVGLMVAEGRPERHHVHETVYQIATGVLAPLYFVAVGLRVNFATNFDLPLVATVLVVACAGKIIGATLGALIGKLDLRQALAVGFGMNARGAMEIILASTALEYRIIDERIFVALVAVALLTSLLSGPAMTLVLRQSSESAATNAA